MSTLDDSLAAGEAALNVLYALLDQAQKSGDLDQQRTLAAAIDDVTAKLSQLRDQQIQADDIQIASLDAALAAVTKAATAAQADLDQLDAALKAAVGVAQLIDSLVTTVAKL